MPDTPTRVYWDACVFLHYVEGTVVWMPTLDAILDEASQAKTVVIYTSTASISEVAFVQAEKADGKLDDSVVDAMDELWKDRSAVKLVEYNEVVARLSRAIVRESLKAGSVIKPFDAIHLATAQIRNVDEFHTMDKPLIAKCKGLTSLTFDVKEPETKQPRLIPDIPQTQELPPNK